MDARKSWLGPPGDAWMARHGLSLATKFNVDAPVVQNFDDSSAQDSADALWRYLGFQVEPCTTRRERAMRTHRLTYEKDPKVDRNVAFNCNLTPKQRLDLPQEFWYNRCLRCGIPEAWFPTKDHNWRNCEYRCWYCQSLAHIHEPCQGYFRQTINGVRQVISEEPPGLGWYERNTRPQTPPRASPPQVQALPEETHYPTVDAPENIREPEVISLLSSSPSADGRDDEELREVAADTLEYPTQEGEFETKDNPQTQVLDARWSYHGAGQQGSRTFSPPKPFSKGSPWTFSSDLEPHPEDVSYLPPSSTSHDFPDVVQSVEWDPSMEFGNHDPGAMNVEYDGSESPQTVICIDSEEDETKHDDIEDDENENDDSESYDSGDDDDYEGEDNHNSPEVIDLTSSSPPPEDSFQEGYAPEPRSDLQLDEDMGFLIDESEDQESDSFPEEAPSSELDENVSQSGSDDHPSSDTIMADDGDVDDAQSNMSTQNKARGLGDLARDSLSPRRRERSVRPPEPSDNEFYHLGSLARDSLSTPRKTDLDAFAPSDNQSNHSDPIVRNHLSPFPEYLEGTPASHDDSCHLGLMARNSLSPLRRNFQRSLNAPYHEPYQLESLVREYYERPFSALTDDGFNDEVNLLPSQQEVAGAFDQASKLLQPGSDTSPRFALSSDQDHGSVSYVSAVEYIHQPTEPHSDPHEQTLEFSEELQSAISHFLSSSPSQEIPGVSAVQHVEYTVQPHKTQEDQWEEHSTPAALYNPNPMISAEEFYHHPVHLDSVAQDESSNAFLPLLQDLESDLQNSLFQDDNDSNWSPDHQGYHEHASMTDSGDPYPSTTLGHVDSSSERGMQSDTNKKDGLSYEMDAMQVQLQREPPSSQTVAGQEDSPTHIDDNECSEYRGVSLQPTSGKTWDVDALEAYYANQREVDSMLGEESSMTDEESDDGDTETIRDLSPTSGEESDDEETDTIRDPSPTSGEGSDDEGTVVIHHPSPVSDTESDEDSDNYEEDNEHYIERSQYDKRRMAGLYEDDDIHNEEEDSRDVQAYEDEEDWEGHEEYDDSSDTIEADHKDDVEWTNYTNDTVTSLYQEGSETSGDTEMEDGEEKARAPSSVTADNEEENRIPEWLFASQTTHQQQQPIHTINIHAAQHYIASPAPALSPSPLSTATTDSTAGPAYDADDTWERSVTAGIPDAVEEISIDELHALAQTGHADAMHVCFMNRAEAAVDAAAANALAMMLADDEEQPPADSPHFQLLPLSSQHQEPPPPSRAHSPSPSPLSSPSAQQLQRESWRAASAPAAAAHARPSHVRYGELSEQRRAVVARARTRSRSPERWRVPSFEDYRQRD